MNKSIIPALQIVLFMIISSCEKEINLKIDEEDKILVVNSIICPDSLMTVKVSYSQSILENQPTSFINNASVLVFEDEVFLDSLAPIGNGKYQSKFKPKTNKKYSLEVSDGTRKVTATCQIPDKGLPVSPSIDTAEVLFGPPMQRLKINLQDNREQKNFYRLFLKAKYYSIPASSGNNLGFSYNDEAINNQTTALGALSNYINDVPRYYYHQELIFSDKYINGTNKEILLSEVHLHEGYTLYIHQQTLSEDYYQYLYSYYNKPIDIFSEPAPMHSNIVNGVGIFGAYNEIIDSLKL